MTEKNLNSFEVAESSSTNTSLSGLTGYEDELYDLKTLTSSNPNLLQTHNKISEPNQDCSTLIYETRIKNLNIELQNSLKLNEKYKHDLFKFEQKVEAENREKINSLIQRNADLEIRLEIANNQIEALLNQRSNVDLDSQVDCLCQELLQCNNARCNAEISVKNLKLELRQAKDEINSRIACVDELKKKICQQHSAIQNLMQENIKFQNRIASFESDLEWCKKSESWYKEQLHLCQNAKVKLSEENAQMLHLISQSNREIENLKSEVSKCRYDFHELRQTSEKERQRLLKNIEGLQAKNCNKNVGNHVEHRFLNSDDNKIRDYYESVINDLGKEIERIRHETVHHQSVFKKLNKENSDLLARVTTLQKSLTDKEIFVQQSESQRKETNNKLILCMQNLEKTKKDNVQLRIEREELQVKLLNLEQEKQEMELMINGIRNDFNKVVEMHNKLKLELHKKDKNILLLQNEKQEQFMRNNWKICELEEIKQNQRVKSLENAVAASSVRENKLIDRNNVLSEENSNYVDKTEKLKETIDFLQKQLLENEEKYKNIITERDRNFDSNFSKELENEITKLKNEKDCEVSERDSIINALQEELGLLKKELVKYDGKIKSVEKEREIEVSKRDFTICALQKEMENLRREQLNKNSNDSEEKLKYLNNLKVQFENEIAEINCEKEREISEKDSLLRILQEELKSLQKECLFKLDLETLHQKKIDCLKITFESEIACLKEDKERVVSEKDSVINALKQEIENLQKVHQNSLKSFDKEEIVSMKIDLSDFCKVLEMLQEKLVQIDHNKFNCDYISITNILENTNVRTSLENLMKSLSNLYTSRQTHLQKIVHLKNRLNTSKVLIAKLKEHISLRTKYMTDKCTKMCEQNEETLKVLQKLHERKKDGAEEKCRTSMFLERCILEEEIKQLKAMIKAREMEMTDKLKRYEINNRTLLKKAKEHMRGRNTAEKQNAYLQQLYDSMCNEFTTLKLDIANKTAELEKLEHSIESNQKLKQAVFGLQQQIAKIHAEKSIVENNLAELQNKCAVYKSENESKERQIKSLLAEVEKVKTDLLQLENEIALQQNRNCELENKIKNTDENLSSIDKLQQDLVDKETDLSCRNKEMSMLKIHIKELEEKNDYLLKEIEIQSSEAERRKEAVESLHKQQVELQDAFNKKESTLKSVIYSLRSDTQLLENEVNSLKNDKFFLQRLCNDLKYALHSSTSQNKILKERINTLTSESKEFSSLPDLMSSLPSPSKYDDTFINKLLRNSSKLPEPLNEVQGCLNSLKKEMEQLRCQVKEKSFNS